MSQSQPKNAVSKLGKRKTPEDHDEEDDERVLKVLYEQLTHAAHQIKNADAYVDACERFNEFLIESVTKHPALANIHKHINDDHDEYPSLLYTTMTELDSYYSHPAIKFLIDTDPSILSFYEQYDDDGGLMFFMTHHYSHHLLITWIAKDHTWFLDDYDCADEGSPDAILVSEFWQGRVTESALRSFLEIYPRILFNKENEFLPLQYIVRGSYTSDCTFDFFQWIVAQNPCVLGLRNYEEKTVLHFALRALGTHKTENMAEICKFIIKSRPDMVQYESLFEEFSINQSGDRSFFSPVEQDIITMVVEVYSEQLYLDVELEEPIKDRFIRLRNLFLHVLKLRFDERKDLEEEMSMLHQVTTNLIDATSVTKNKMNIELSNVFHSWSTLRTQQRERKIKGIPKKIKILWEQFEKKYYALPLADGGRRLE